MVPSRVVSVVSVAVAVPAMFVATATPSSAVASVAAGTCGYGGYAQTCEGWAQDVPGLGTGADVTVACTAATAGRVVEATIVGCYIRGNNGDVHYAPDRLTNGQSSTRTYTFDSWGLLSRTYELCVGAGYYNPGVYRAPTGFRCGTTA